ncbi:MAG: hypothetical protein PWQ12_1924 [Clostridiales bacterium]|nr:hypothetical protein [Clostridiales bacterium]
MKRIGILSLIAVLLVMAVYAGAPVNFAAPKPVIGIVGSEDVQTVIAGSQGEYSIQLQNISYTVAKDIKVTLTGNHPFRTDVGSLIQTVRLLNPGESDTVDFTVYASPTAEAKTYEFEVQIEFYDYYETYYVSTQKVYVKVINNYVEPILGVVDYSTGQSALETGKPDSLLLNIKNTGSIAAKEVQVSVDGFSNEGVVLYRDVDTKQIQSIEGGDTELLYFNVIAGPDAVTGTFPINVHLEYIDEYGGTYEKQTTVYLELAGAEAVDGSLSISDPIYPDTVRPNQDFTVSYTVTNNGETTIGSADATLAYDPAFISKSNAKVLIKNLEPGESQTIDVTLMAKSDTASETYHNYLTVTYTPLGATEDEAKSVQAYVGIYVNSESTEGSKPKLIIANYDYGGEYAYAGNEFTLTLDIKNTSTVEGTKNIKVTLSSEDSVFTPVDASSSFFIPSIGPGQVYTYSLKLKTKVDASVKIYALTAKMEYEDSNGNAYDQNDNPYEESEDLSVAVAQPVRLETGEVSIPYEIYSGNPFYIEQEFYNMGKSTMYNMMVKINGVETNEGSYFVGNFESGSSDYFSAQVYAYDPGSYEGTLVYTFEDALGNVSTIEKPFSYTVMEMPVYDDNGGGVIDEPFPVEDPGQSGGVSGYVIGGVLLLVLVAGFFIFRNRRKKRMQKELEDLDE